MAELTSSLDCKHIQVSQLSSSFLGTKRKCNCKGNLKIQPTRASHHNPSRNEEIMLICGLSIQATTTLLRVMIRFLTPHVESNLLRTSWQATSKAYSKSLSVHFHSILPKSCRCHNYHLQKIPDISHISIYPKIYIVLGLVTNW